MLMEAVVYSTFRNHLKVNDEFEQKKILISKKYSRNIDLSDF